MQILMTLCNEIGLNKKHRLHKLVGDYDNLFECHIEPDWLLIFNLTDTHIELIRMGSHSELF